MIKIAFNLILSLLLFSTCQSPKQKVLPISEEAFTANIEGKSTTLYTLTNNNGMTVELTNYGARIISIWVKDKDGCFRDVVWGHASIEDYINTPIRYANPIIGCVANRISKGQFSLQGKSYQLSLNNNGNHLHGGNQGFEAKVWKAKILEEGRTVEMSYLSEDGEEGYPGNLLMTVTYSLSDDNKLTLSYTASTDAITIVNPTTHVMLNLTGSSNNDVLQHQVQISADSILVMDQEGIPTGQLLALKGTPLDFRTSHRIGASIDTDFRLLTQAKGYDHYYIFRKNINTKAPKANVICPETGIKLQVFTDQLGLQFYTGNFFAGTVSGKRGELNNYRSIFALECQNYPNAINHAHFPSIVLHPDETYRQETSYAFSIIEE